VNAIEVRALFIPNLFVCSMSSCSDVPSYFNNQPRRRERGEEGMEGGGREREGRRGEREKVHQEAAKKHSLGVIIFCAQSVLLFLRKLVLRNVQQKKSNANIFFLILFLSPLSSFFLFFFL
jgi:hypothetical protein